MTSGNGKVWEETGLVITNLPGVRNERKGRLRPSKNRPSKLSPPPAAPILTSPVRR